LAELLKKVSTTSPVLGLRAAVQLFGGGGGGDVVVGCVVVVVVVL
jgi:hypothetical protein